MRAVYLLCTALLCACAPSLQSGAPASDVELEVEPDEVAAGDSVTLELENDSRGQVTYNLCTSGIERNTGSGWQTIPEDRFCTMELRILASGEEAHYGLRLPERLTPGEYRFHTTVGLEETGASEEIRSESFRVVT